MQASTSAPNGSATNQDPVVVSELTKTYPGPVQAVRGLSFRVRTGEIFGLLGPNGAGKTTTVGVLTTLTRPTSGQAAVGGYDVWTELVEVRRSIGVVFQDSVLDNDFRRNIEHIRGFAFKKLLQVKLFPERIGLVTVQIVGKE